MGSFVMPCVGKSEAPSPKKATSRLFHDDSGTQSIAFSPYLKDPRQQIDYAKIIFPEKLIGEFKERYEDVFGYTETERNYIFSNKYTVVTTGDGRFATVDEEYELQRDYGGYVVKRLLEHHVDQYFQHSSSLRPLYRVKERLSNVKIEVKKGYQMNINYSLSGNYISINVKNPYDLRARIRLEMNKSSFGPSEVEDTILSIGKDLNKTVAIDSYFSTETGKVSFVGKKFLQPHLVASITGSTYTKAFQESEENEKLILIGLSYLF